MAISLLFLVLIAATPIKTEIPTAVSALPVPTLEYFNQIKCKATTFRSYKCTSLFVDLKYVPMKKYDSAMQNMDEVTELISKTLVYVFEEMLVRQSDDGFVVNLNLRSAQPTIEAIEVDSLSGMETAQFDAKSRTLKIYLYRPDVTAKQISARGIYYGLVTTLPAVVHESFHFIQYLPYSKIPSIYGPAAAYSDAYKEFPFWYEATAYWAQEAHTRHRKDRSKQRYSSLTDKYEFGTPIGNEKGNYCGFDLGMPEAKYRAYASVDIVRQVIRDIGYENFVELFDSKHDAKYLRELVSRSQQKLCQR